MSSGRCLTLLFLIPLALLQSGCLSMRSVSIQAMEDLQFEMNAGAPRIRFGLRVENPNNWGVRLLEAETRLSLDDKFVGKAIATEQLNIRKKSTTVVPVVLHTTYGELLRLLPQGFELITGQRSIVGRAQGSVRVGKFIFRKRIAFDLAQKLDQKTLKSILRK